MLVHAVLAPPPLRMSSAPAVLALLPQDDGALLVRGVGSQPTVARFDAAFDASAPSSDVDIAASVVKGCSSALGAGANVRLIVAGELDETKDVIFSALAQRCAEALLSSPGLLSLRASVFSIGIGDTEPITDALAAVAGAGGRGPSATTPASALILRDDAQLGVGATGLWEVLAATSADVGELLAVSFPTAPSAGPPAASPGGAAGPPTSPPTAHVVMVLLAEWEPPHSQGGGGSPDAAPEAQRRAGPRRSRVTLMRLARASATLDAAPFTATPPSPAPAPPRIPLWVRSLAGVLGSVELRSPSPAFASSRVTLMLRDALCGRECPGGSALLVVAPVTAPVGPSTVQFGVRLRAAAAALAAYHGGAGPSSGIRHRSMPQVAGSAMDNISNSRYGSPVLPANGGSRSAGSGPFSSNALYASPSRPQQQQSTRTHLRRTGGGGLKPVFSPAPRSPVLRYAAPRSPVPLAGRDAGAYGNSMYVASAWKDAERGNRASGSPFYDSTPQPPTTQPSPQTRLHQQQPISLQTPAVRTRGPGASAPFPGPPTPSAAVAVVDAAVAAALLRRASVGSLHSSQARPSRRPPPSPTVQLVELLLQQQQQQAYNADTGYSAPAAASPSTAYTSSPPHQHRAIGRPPVRRSEVLAALATATVARKLSAGRSTAAERGESEPGVRSSPPPPGIGSLLRLSQRPAPHFSPIEGHRIHAASAAGSVSASAVAVPSPPSVTLAGNAAPFSTSSPVYGSALVGAPMSSGARPSSSAAAAAAPASGTPTLSDLASLYQLSLRALTDSQTELATLRRLVDDVRAERGPQGTLGQGELGQGRNDLLPLPPPQLSLFEAAVVGGDRVAPRGDVTAHTGSGSSSGTVFEATAATPEGMVAQTAPNASVPTIDDGALPPLQPQPDPPGSPGFNLTMMVVHTSGDSGEGVRGAATPQQQPPDVGIDDGSAEAGEGEATGPPPAPASDSPTAPLVHRRQLRSPKGTGASGLGLPSPAVIYGYSPADLQTDAIPARGVLHPTPGQGVEEAEEEGGGGWEGGDMGGRGAVEVPDHGVETWNSDEEQLQQHELQQHLHGDASQALPPLSPSPPSPSPSPSPSSAAPSIPATADDDGWHEPGAPACPHGPTLRAAATEIVALRAALAAAEAVAADAQQALGAAAAALEVTRASEAGLRREHRDCGAYRAVTEGTLERSAAEVTRAVGERDAAVRRERGAASAAARDKIALSAVRKRVGELEAEVEALRAAATVGRAEAGLCTQLREALSAAREGEAETRGRLREMQADAAEAAEEVSELRGRLGEALELLSGERHRAALLQREVAVLRELEEGGAGDRYMGHLGAGDASLGHQQQQLQGIMGQGYSPTVPVAPPSIPRPPPHSSASSASLGSDEASVAVEGGRGRAAPAPGHPNGTNGRPPMVPRRPPPTPQREGASRSGGDGGGSASSERPGGRSSPARAPPLSPDHTATAPPPTPAPLRPDHYLFDPQTGPQGRGSDARSSSVGSGQAAAAAPLPQRLPLQPQQRHTSTQRAVSYHPLVADFAEGRSAAEQLLQEWGQGGGGSPPSSPIYPADSSSAQSRAPPTPGARSHVVYHSGRSVSAVKPGRAGVSRTAAHSAPQQRQQLLLPPRGRYATVTASSASEGAQHGFGTGPARGGSAEDRAVSKRGR